MKFVHSIVHPIVQTTVHPIVHNSHPDNVAEVDNPVTDSPLFTLASISAELLKDDARETVPTLSQGMSHERQIPYVDFETPSRELSPLPESKQPTKPSTPNQPTLGQLTQELAQSMSWNEEYPKLIVEL